MRRPGGASSLRDVVERNATAHVLAAATGLGLAMAQEDVATVLDALREAAASGAVTALRATREQRDALVLELARARGCSVDVVRVAHGIDAPAARS